MSLIDLSPSPTREHEISHGEVWQTDVTPRDTTTSIADNNASTRTVVKNATYDNPQDLGSSSAALVLIANPSTLSGVPLINLEPSLETNSGVLSTLDSRNSMESSAEIQLQQSQPGNMQPPVSNSLAGSLEALSLSDQGNQSTTATQHVPEVLQSSSTLSPLPKDDKYLQLLPSSSTPTRKASPIPASGHGSQEEEWNEKDPYENKIQPQHINVGDTDFDEKAQGEGENNEDSRPEISSIIEQFTGDKTFKQDPTSPTSRDIPVFKYPPRTSSLEHLTQSPPGASAETKPEDNTSPTSPPRDPERGSISYASSIRSQPPRPEPDPEPDLPFDFHRFLEQLRHRTADPVAKFLRSFLQEFGKKQWQVHEQVKIIGDFLTFISNRMAQCEIWKNVSDAEFDNAREGMEKLVMNRLYTQTFSPEIPPSEPSPVKGRRKGASTPLGPGRKGQHEEDVERDEVLAQKIRIYGWLREEHLDMKPFGDKGRKFLLLAQQELSKIKSYRAPRDKIICVLNCCKVIFGYLRNSQFDQSADTFIPLLIYTVLKANPDHLVSNLQYILRFRNQEKLGGEAGYYLSSLMGAVQFIETLDRTNLTVSDEEFDKNVEAAVSEIAAHNEQEEKRTSPPSPVISHPLQSSEKSGPSRPEPTQRHSIEGERSSHRRSTAALSSDEQSSDEKAAVSGLLRTIQRPLSTIGRIFSDEATATITSPSSSTADRPPSTPQPPNRPSRPPGAASSNHTMPPGAAAAEERTRLRHEDAVALQASAEAAEAHNIMRAEHHTVVETLAGMFPDLDPEIISDVVRMKEGRIGLAVDACLALSH